jgi:hypothetical protein
MPSPTNAMPHMTRLCQPGLREDDGVLEGANRIESSVPPAAVAGRFFDDHEMPCAGGWRTRGGLRRSLEAPFAEPRGARAARRRGARPWGNFS